MTNKKELHHMRNVLRLKVKDAVATFDDRANEYETEIEQLSARKAVLKIKASRKEAARKKTRITIACAIPKRSKIDDIIDKLTQLGVERIIPLITKRVIVSLDEKKKVARLRRWQRIAQSASLQSQRNTLPIIDPVSDFKEVLSSTQGYDLKLIPTLFGERASLREILQKDHYENILIFIGPEGDFSPAEVSLAMQSGFIPVTFGDTVLRVETAAVYVASVFNYIYI